jgi:hypothetical protein
MKAFLKDGVSSSDWPESENGGKTTILLPTLRAKKRFIKQFLTLQKRFNSNFSGWFFSAFSQ